MLLVSSDLSFICFSPDAITYMSKLANCQQELHAWLTQMGLTTDLWQPNWKVSDHLCVVMLNSICFYCWSHNAPIWTSTIKNVATINLVVTSSVGVFFCYLLTHQHWVLLMSRPFLVWMMSAKVCRLCFWSWVEMRYDSEKYKDLNSFIGT